MTCIVAAIEGRDGSIVMGGDSAGVSGLDVTVRADEKVFTNGAFIMGFTSSFRMGQLLRYALKPPSQEYGQDMFAFMAINFVDAVRDCLKKGGYAKKENETESAGTFIVGYNGRIFTVHSDYQVSEAQCDFASVGCGESYALGALHVMNKSGWSAEIRVRIALEAAARFSGGVRAFQSCQAERLQVQTSKRLTHEPCVC